MITGCILRSGTSASALRWTSSLRTSRRSRSSSANSPLSLSRSKNTLAFPSVGAVAEKVNIAGSVPGEIRKILFGDGVNGVPAGAVPVRPGGDRAALLVERGLHDIGFVIGGEQSCLARRHIHGKQRSPVAFA